MDLAALVDAVVEAPVVPSFTRFGFDVRSRVGHWRQLADYNLRGRTVLLTGATSGLGLAAAEQLARCGAEVILLGRDPDKTARVRDVIASRTGNTTLRTAVADMGDLDAVRAVADSLLTDGSPVHAVLHNAGTLSATRGTSAQGTEATVAAQVVGPFLLTALLLPLLRTSAPARVLTMSSGGMYVAPLTVDELEMTGAAYRGSEQYARAKRAQVTLNEMWSHHVPRSQIVFHALHPGWADTPGVEASLPTFRRVLGPALRTPAQGADTLVWLTADDTAPLGTTGGFWLDRRPRPIHKLPHTKRSDTPQRREALWRWCCGKAGIDPFP